MIEYNIKSRWTGDVLFTAKINCVDSTLDDYKKGLAVKWAVENGVSLRDADLSATFLLPRAALRNTDFRNADLTGACLHDAYLQGANLQNADMQNGQFWCADFRGADLRYANLRGAQLYYAEFAGAKLRYADLRGAYLTGAKNMEQMEKIND